MPAERFKSSERGSSLVEIMIAVLVLSAGLVGGLKLQSESMRQSSDSRHVVAASALAHDALDQIVSGRQSSASWILAEGASPASTTPVGQWLARVKTTLPDAKASIACNGGICTVLLKWTPPGREQVTASYKVRSPG